MPVQGFLGLEFFGAGPTLVYEQVGKVDGLDVVANVAPRCLCSLAYSADVAAAATANVLQLEKNREERGLEFNADLFSVSDPDSGVFWIRIQGLKKRSKMLNNHDIILLFSDFYNILSFN